MLLLAQADARSIWLLKRARRALGGGAIAFEEESMKGPERTILIAPFLCHTLLRTFCDCRRGSDSCKNGWPYAMALPPGFRWHPFPLANRRRGLKQGDIEGTNRTPSFYKYVGFNRNTEGKSGRAAPTHLGISWDTPPVFPSTVMIGFSTKVFKPAAPRAESKVSKELLNNKKFYHILPIQRHTFHTYSARTTRSHLQHPSFRLINGHLPTDSDRHVTIAPPVSRHPCRGSSLTPIGQADASAQPEHLWCTTRAASGLGGPERLKHPAVLNDCMQETKPTSPFLHKRLCHLNSFCGPLPKLSASMSSPSHTFARSVIPVLKSYPLGNGRPKTAKKAITM